MATRCIRNCQCDIVLNVNAPTEDRSGGTKDSSQTLQECLNASVCVITVTLWTTWQFLGYKRRLERYSQTENLKWDFVLEY